VSGLDLEFIRTPLLLSAGWWCISICHCHLQYLPAFGWDGRESHPRGTRGEGRRGGEGPWSFVDARPQRSCWDGEFWSCSHR